MGKALYIIELRNYYAPITGHSSYCFYSVSVTFVSRLSAPSLTRQLLARTINRFTVQGYYSPTSSFYPDIFSNPRDLWREI